MVKLNTHPNISERLCGAVVELAEGRAVVEMSTCEEMGADPQGLVHGGFVFGAVDYAAMAAVNDPNVVLGSADVRFVAPVRVGETVHAYAERTLEKGRKHVVEVSAKILVA